MYAMAEALVPSISIAGFSTWAEHEATSAPSLVTKLRCPQPVAIARRGKCLFGPFHVASKGQQGMATSIRSLSRHYNECASSLTAVYHSIPRTLLRIIGRFLGIFLRNSTKNNWEL